MQRAVVCCLTSLELRAVGRERTDMNSFQSDQSTGNPRLAGLSLTAASIAHHSPHEHSPADRRHTLRLPLSPSPLATLTALTLSLAVPPPPPPPSWHRHPLVFLALALPPLTVGAPRGVLTLRRSVPTVGTATARPGCPQPRIVEHRRAASRISIHGRVRTSSDRVYPHTRQRPSPPTQATSRAFPAQCFPKGCAVLVLCTRVYGSERPLYIVLYGRPWTGLGALCSDLTVQPLAKSTRSPRPPPCPPPHASSLCTNHRSPAKCPYKQYLHYLNRNSPRPETVSCPTSHVTH